MARTLRPGVRDRVARANDPSLQDLLARVDDQTIATAIRGLRDLERRWLAVPLGGELKPVWPLARGLFPGGTGGACRGGPPGGATRRCGTPAAAPETIRPCFWRWGLRVLTAWPTAAWNPEASSPHRPSLMPNKDSTTRCGRSWTT